LLDWARDHGKTVVCVEPFIDFSTPTGQLVGMIMSWLAEQELAQLTQRSNDTKQYLQSNGYLSGKAPFGFRIVQHRDHKSLEPDPVDSQLVRDAVALHLDGTSLRNVAKWLNCIITKLDIGENSAEVVFDPKSGIWPASAELSYPPPHRTDMAPGRVGFGAPQVQSEVEPTLLVLDEVFSMLDLAQRNEMYSLLTEKAYGFQIVITSVLDPPDDRRA
jgi:hypothetical protein